jgi:hypothetical protein
MVDGMENVSGATIRARASRPLTVRYDSREIEVSAMAGETCAIGPDLRIVTGSESAAADLRLTAHATSFDVAAFDRARVLRAADAYLAEDPITITASRAPRSAGGLHDFFSEGDYWWPDPENPGGPYIQRDGLSNPDNFLDHRRYLMRVSLHVPTLAAAWKLTRDAGYAHHAARHLRGWFIDPATRMNPHLRYAQAIQRCGSGGGSSQSRVRSSSMASKGGARTTSDPDQPATIDQRPASSNRTSSVRAIGSTNHTCPIRSRAYTVSFFTRSIAAVEGDSTSQTQSGAREK